MSRINFSIILILGLMSTVVHSMRFDLQSGATKCISDDIKSSSMTVGKYAVVNPKEGFPIPDSHKLTIRVTSPYGSNYHYGDHVESGNFAFTAAETGDYSACFWVSDHKPSTTVTIDFDWKTGVAAKDWSKVAKKGQIETMELELKKLYDTVSSIHDEMFYLREREEGMQQLNRSTNSKMAVFSGLSLFVCLSSCLSMTHLKQIHGRAVVTNLQHHAIVLAKMFRFAAISPSGDLSYAHRLLNCVDPDEFTFTFLLKSRSRMKIEAAPIVGSDEIHGIALKFGFCAHLFVQNALIHIYMGREGYRLRRGEFSMWQWLVTLFQQGNWRLEFARQVFDEMPERDVVSWTAMISAYSQAKYSREALDLFWEINHVETGVCIHIDDNGFVWMVSLCNALIDMYAKCGCMDQAWQVFDKMSRKSLVTWNSMISACANHGNADDAFGLVTFLALLVAYTHKGLVDEGLRLFERIQTDYRIKARIEHYGCMVDMLGKAGRLEEAYRLISNMPIPGNDVVWGTLLAASRAYGDAAGMGGRVVNRLLELKPDEGGYYILLRDIYVAAGRTMEANAMRRRMNVNGASKTPGCSWVGA
ncbi:unnamed protein product [Malus baccata var. baccata]